MATAAEVNKARKVLRAVELKIIQLESDLRIEREPARRAKLQAQLKRQQANRQSIINYLGTSGGSLNMSDLARGVGSAAVLSGPSLLRGVISKIPGVGTALEKGLEPFTDITKSITDAGRAAAGLPKIFDRIKQPVSSISKDLEPIDKLFVSLRRGTIGAGDLSKRLIELRKDTLAIGVSNEDLRKTYDALFKANLSFTEYLDKKAADSLVKYVSILEKFGVAGTLTGDISNTLSKQLGFGATKTENFLKKLAGTAKSLGLSLPKAFQDFKQSADRFVLTGVDQMSSRFAKLQALTKATGISTGDLVNTFGKATDTFDGSVKISARLNAMLGTNISAMKLLRNDAEQNVSLIAKALRTSGKTFDQLGKFEKLMLMQATGIKSASQLKSLMEMSPVELELKQLRGQMSKAAGLQDELRTRATTRAELVKGVGEVMQTKQLKMVSDALKSSFSAAMTDVKKGQKLGQAFFRQQLRDMEILTNASVATQETLLLKTFPEKFSATVTKAQAPLVAALKLLAKSVKVTLDEPRSKSIKVTSDKSRSNTKVGGKN